MPKCFISYSWDSEAHKAWVAGLAARLREDGIESILDQWHTYPGDQLPHFMEIDVRESNYVLIICTIRYKTKSDGRVGGVGYEGDIMTAEVFSFRNQRKFIPVLREIPKVSALPQWLSGKYFVDLSSEPYSEQQYMDLLTTLLGTRQQAPPVYPTRTTTFQESPRIPNSHRTFPSSANSIFEDIKILGIMADEVTSPRRDGSRGCELYAIPFRLSSTPPNKWIEFFISSWDMPPRSTSMHRPRIASITGNKVILNGTTIDEVEKYHRQTILLALKEANEKYKQFLEAEERNRQRELDRINEHRQHIDRIAGSISFDEDSS